MSLSPILLFAYQRLPHLKMTVDALAKNIEARESDLVIFSDAPRSEQQVNNVEAVRKYIRTIEGFQSITIVEREKNYGLANSIIDGVSSVIDRYGKVIVVEDDIVTSPFFLQYMNEALHKYERREEVISIHGYCYPTSQNLPETFFLRGADCWGWATWKRGWDHFESDAQKLLHGLRERKLQRRFDFDNTYDYTGMLEKQVMGEIDSWAIRWYASAFLADKLTLYPGRSLVNNIGGDDLATHTKSLSVFQTTVAQSPIILGDPPIAENDQARNAFSEFFRTAGESYPRRFLKFILNLIRL